MKSQIEEILSHFQPDDCANISFEKDGTSYVCSLELESYIETTKIGDTIEDSLNLMYKYVISNY